MDAENTRRNTMKDLTLNNLPGSDKIYSPALHYIEYPPPPHSGIPIRGAVNT